jgi:hypothetical protein
MRFIALTFALAAVASGCSSSATDPQSVKVDDVTSSLGGSTGTQAINGGVGAQGIGGGVGTSPGIAGGTGGQGIQGGPGGQGISGSGVSLGSGSPGQGGGGSCSQEVEQYGGQSGAPPACLDCIANSCCPQLDECVNSQGQDCSDYEQCAEASCISPCDDQSSVGGGDDSGSTNLGDDSGTIITTNGDDASEDACSAEPSGFACTLGGDCCSGVCLNGSCE